MNMKMNMKFIHCLKPVYEIFFVSLLALTLNQIQSSYGLTDREQQELVKINSEIFTLNKEQPKLQPNEVLWRVERLVKLYDNFDLEDTISQSTDIKKFIKEQELYAKILLVVGQLDHEGFDKCNRDYFTQLALKLDECYRYLDRYLNVLPYLQYYTGEQYDICKKNFAYILRDAVENRLTKEIRDEVTILMEHICDKESLLLSLMLREPISRKKFILGLISFVEFKLNASIRSQIKNLDNEEGKLAYANKFKQIVVENLCKIVYKHLDPSLFILNGDKEKKYLKLENMDQFSRDWINIARGCTAIVFDVDAIIDDTYLELTSLKSKLKSLVQ